MAPFPIRIFFFFMGSNTKNILKILITKILNTKCVLIKKEIRDTLKYPERDQIQGGTAEESACQKNLTIKNFNHHISR